MATEVECRPCAACGAFTPHTPPKGRGLVTAAVLCFLLGALLLRARLVHALVPILLGLALVAWHRRRKQYVECERCRSRAA